MIETIIVLAIAGLTILTGCLNRLRGTGTIKQFGTVSIGKYEINITLTWNHVFAVYYGLIFGYISGMWYIGVLTSMVYIAGESNGWGEWIGALTKVDTEGDTKDEKWIQRQYKDEEGKNFPFIHQISNFFIKEQREGTLEQKIKQYYRYATLAIILRGMWWFIGIELIAVYCFLIPWYISILSLIFIGLSFPLACYLGKITNINGNIKFIYYSRGWENQEIYFGMFQFIIIILPIILYKFFI